ncbi:MAG: hypothetical protein KJZ70_10720 [Bryobacterales bacterium]|nr:hypothetical protein [Bryobacterales bacterium]
MRKSWDTIRGLIDTVLSLMTRQHTPPAVYMEHALLTPETISRYYAVTGD